MSFFNGFKINDLSSFDCTLIKDIISLKNLLLEKLEKNCLILDTQGNEYKKDDIDKIETRKKDLEFIIYNGIDFISNSLNDNLSKKELSDKILKILNIESVLNKYLTSKKDKIKQSFKVCQEIQENCIILKEIDNYDLNNFEQYFSKISKDNEEIKKYINMIKQSINQIKELSPTYKENIDKIENLLNQTIIEIEKSLNYNLKGKAHYNTEDINELQKVFSDYNSHIREKILKIINEQTLTFNLESKINEILIYAEKINFYINLGQIPKMYDNFKKNLEKELKRRIYFKNTFSKINDFLNSILSEEFEIRKNFFKKNMEISKNFKIDKKTIEILNRLIDIEEEKVEKELNDKISGNNIIIENKSISPNNDDENIKEKIVFDEDILKTLDDLQNYLNGVRVILDPENKSSKKKENIELNKPKISGEKLNDINDKFSKEIKEIKIHLSDVSVPPEKQKVILGVIENKIIKNLYNSDNNIYDKKKNVSLNSFNNDINESDIFMSGNDVMFNKDAKNYNNLASKVIDYFINTYSKFLFFYNKVYEYLYLYLENHSSKLKKEEPFTLNKCLVDILNENRSLREKIQKIQEQLK